MKIKLKFSAFDLVVIKIKSHYCSHYNSNANFYELLDFFLKRHGIPDDLLFFD
jgi:hypothetical protein